MTVRSRVQQGGAVDRRIPAALAVFLLLLLAVFLFLGRSDSSSEHKSTTRQQAATDKPSASSTPAAIQQAPRPAATKSARNGPPVAASTKEPQLEWKGRVLSEATGAPIAGALVEVLATDGKHGGRRGEAVLEQVGKPAAAASATTNANGEWEIRVPVPQRDAGVECLYVSAAGYASRTASVILELWRPANPLIIRLPDGGEIAGRVVDAAGSGINGAFVGGIILDKVSYANPINGVIYTFATWGGSGPDGAFLLAGVPLDTSIRIPARKQGYITGISDVVRVGDQDVRIVLGTGGATISGLVFDAEDRPAPGIHVTVGLDWRPGEDYRRALVHAAATATNTEGAFAFAHLPGGKWRVTAARGISSGMVEEVSELLSLEEETSATVELRFRKPVTVIGRAFDVDSKAGVPGVRVSTTTYTVYTNEGARVGVATPTKRLEAISDGAGNFRLSVPYKEAVRLFFKAPDGWLREAGDTPSSVEDIYLAGLVGGEERRVEAPFVQGVSLRGKVTFANGNPAPGINMTATEKPNWRQVTTVTDARGEFVLPVQRNRTIDLMAKGDSGWGEASVRVPASGAPPEVTIVLADYCSVAGTVRTDKGEPVPGVAVVTMRMTEGGGALSMFGRESMTDAEGHYAKDKLASGTIAIGLRLPGGLDYATPEPMHVELLPGERKENQDFVLSAGETIEGTIANEEKEPIAGASIQWHTSGMMTSMLEGERTVQSDRQGRFRITGLREGAVLQSLSVSHDDYEGQSRENITALDGEQNFTLRKRGVITLVAVDEATNSPITRYEYRLLRYAWEGIVPLGPPAVHVRSDDGKATLRQIDPGLEFVAVAEIGVDGIPTGRRGQSMIDPGGEKRSEILVRVAGGGSVSGIVVADKTGEPIEGARVAVRQFGTEIDPAVPPPSGAFDFPQATTGRDGRFTLRGLMAVDCNLTAVKGELRPVECPRVVIRSGAESEEVVIRMERMASIYGKAICPDGKPLAGATVLGRRMVGESTQPTRTDDNGAYRLKGLEAGYYTVLIAMDSESVDESQGVEVMSGEEKEVNFDLTGLLTLSGTVRIDGSPWRGGISRLYLWAGDDRAAPLRAKDGGRYQCRVRPGSWRLTLQEGSDVSGVVRFVDLPATPREQTMDFDITIVSADIVLDSADGVDFTPGWISLNRRVAGQDLPAGSRINADTARRHLPRILPGEYRAFFSANDGSLTGESDWTSITPGGENVIYVPVKKAAR